MSSAGNSTQNYVRNRGSKEMSLLPHTGASTHCCNDLQMFDNYRSVSPETLTGLGGYTVTFKGSISMKWKSSTGRSNSVILLDVSYVPTLPVNLLAAGLLEDWNQPARLDSRNGKIHIRLASTSEEIGYATRLPNRLYRLILDRPIRPNKSSINTTLQPPSTGRVTTLQPSSTGRVTTLAVTPPLTLPAVTNSVSANLWHRRLAHVGTSLIRKLQTSGNPSLQGIDFGASPDDIPSLCETCELSKAQRQVSRTTPTRPQAPFAEIGMDVLGPVTPQGRRKEKYALVFVCTFTKARIVSWMETKGYAFQKIKELEAYVRTQYPNYTIRAYNLDGGLEFGGNQFAQHCRDKGIDRRVSAPYTHEQAGDAESSIKVLKTRARSLLTDSGLPQQFWPDALELATHISNRVPTSRGQVPLALLKPPSDEPDTNADPKTSIRHLRRFGCLAYVHIPPEKRVKSASFKPRALRGYFIGYQHQGTRNMNVWIPEINKVWTTPHVRLDESQVFKDFTPETGIQHTADELRPHVEITESSIEIPIETLLRTSSTSSNTDFLELDGLTAGDTSDPLEERDGNEHTGEQLHPGGTQAGPLAPPAENLNMEIQETISRDRSFDRFTHEPANQSTPFRSGSHQADTRGADCPNLDIRETSRRTSPHEESDGNQHRPLVLGPDTESGHEDEPEEAPEPTYRTSRGRQANRPDYKALSNRGRAAFASSAGVVLSSISSKPHTPTPDKPADPKTHEEAVLGVNGHHWRKAETSEIQQMLDQKVFRFIDSVPSGQRPIDGKFVYKTKYKPDGSIEKYKARWVARGFWQQLGVNYDSTYAPTSRTASYRLLFSLAALNNWKIYQCDVVGAFLHSDLDYTVYMKAPPGTEKMGRYVEVLKSLYGLKQAPHLWYKALKETLQKRGFHPLPTDACVFTNKDTSAYVLVFVDDLILTGPNTKLLLQIKQGLAEDFDLKELEVQTYLGLQIERNKGHILLHQEPYTLDLLSRFNMENCKAAPTPGVVSNQVIKRPTDDPADNDLIHRFRTIIGCLQHLANHTRPDIAYQVSYLARFASNPWESQYTDARRVLRYLRGTTKLGLTYNTEASKPSLTPSLTLTGYVDSDWAGDETTRRSTYGFIFFLNGGPISWASRLHPTIALSSTEAEYAALAEATRETSWLVQHMTALGLASKQSITPVVLFEDNQSTISLATNHVNHRRSKHVDVRNHYCREMFEKRLIDVQYIPTLQQSADGFTKPLGPQKWETYLQQLHMTR